MNPIKEFSLKELKPLITLYFRELFNFIMNKKPYIYFVCILLYFTVLSPHSYASETLRDIHADISILQ